MASTCEPYQKMFLRGYPVKLLLPDLLAALRGRDEATQKDVLKNTVDLPLVKQYPLKTEYMQTFLKSLITELEKTGVEVCDELYETYCNLLRAPTGVRETHYRHFMLDNCLDNCITVEESTKLISQGTTGLFTWQASQALVSWCTSHKNELQNKCVLELGSGAGLAGLAVCVTCEPSSFWFSDCHSSVLQLLLSNVNVNVERNALSNDDLCTKELDDEFPQYVKDNSLFHGRLKGTSVYVMNLPWEEVATSNISELLSPDIILAADVVYDTVSFEPLCEALSHLVRGPRSAILSCTVRNEDTLNQFLELLATYQLSINVEPAEVSSDLLCLDEMPIKVYKISKPNN